VKQGYRIIDTDTHVGPSIETLEQFAGPALAARWDELRPYYQPSSEGGHFLSIEPMAYKRRMGASYLGDESVRGGKSPLKGSVSKERPPYEPGVNDLNSAGRLRDMDTEGVDVHLIIPGTFAYAVSALEPALAVEIYAAYHRYIEAYCSVDPARLKATMPVSSSGSPTHRGSPPSRSCCPRACRSTTPASTRSGKPSTSTTYRCSTTRSSTSRRTSPATAMCGATSSSPARPLIPGAPSGSSPT
jgi:hypothetical protein